MRAAALALVALALLTLVPAPAEAHECNGKPVWLDRCAWPGGVAEACVLQEHVHVCFGPI